MCSAEWSRSGATGGLRGRVQHYLESSQIPPFIFRICDQFPSQKMCEGIPLRSTASTPSVPLCARRRLLRPDRPHGRLFPPAAACPSHRYPRCIPRRRRRHPRTESSDSSPGAKRHTRADAHQRGRGGGTLLLTTPHSSLPGPTASGKCPETFSDISGKPNTFQIYIQYCILYFSIPNVPFFPFLPD